MAQKKEVKIKDLKPNKDAKGGMGARQQTNTRPWPDESGHPPNRLESRQREQLYPRALVKGASSDSRPAVRTRAAVHLSWFGENKEPQATVSPAAFSF